MSEDLADTPTPKPQAGEWTLTAPDGRQWHADSPIRCVSAEQRERVPASVALARIMREGHDAPAGQQGEARTAREQVRRLAEGAKYYIRAALDAVDTGNEVDLKVASFDAIDRLAALATQAAPEARTDKYSLTVASGERDNLRALLREARSVMEGRVGHVWMARCPDELEGHDMRDPDCPACQVLARIDAALADGGAK